MVKKILLSLLLLFLLLIGVFFIWKYVRYLRDPNPNKTFLLPRVELTVLEITSLTVEKTEIASKLLVLNQMPFSFTLDSIQYTLFINDVEVLKSSHRKSMTLKSNDSSWVSLPFTILNQDVDSLIKANERKNIDSVEYRLESSFYTDIVFKRKFNVEVTRFLPLVHIPKLEVEHLEVDSLDFSRAVIKLHTSILNKNVFSLKFEDIAYEFAIEDNEWVRGVIPGITYIKADSVTELIIPVTLTLKEVRKTLFDLLKKGSGVKYKLLLTLKIKTDLKLIKNSDLVLESSGTVKSLIKFVKNKPEKS